MKDYGPIKRNGQCKCSEDILQCVFLVMQLLFCFPFFVLNGKIITKNSGMANPSLQ